MYIAARAVADARDHTLHNLLAASTAYIEAGQRLTGLFARIGREVIAHGGRQVGKLADGGLPAQAPDFWIGNLPYPPAQLLEEAVNIFGATQTAVVQAAQAQIDVCDRFFATAIDRAAQNSPWEGELALGVVRSALKNAGQTLQTLSSAAIQTVELAESQVKQAARPPRGKKAQ